MARSSMVEPAAHNRLVVGSIPAGSTKFKNCRSYLRYMGYRGYKLQLPSLVWIPTKNIEVNECDLVISKRLQRLGYGEILYA